jgi:hypothetical protein
MKRYRRQWYHFGTGLTYGVAQQDTTSTANIKAAGNYFTTALVGQSAYQIICKLRFNDPLLTLINNNNNYYNVLMGISADLRNRFFTNPTYYGYSKASCTEAVAAQQVICS